MKTQIEILNALRNASAGEMSPEIVAARAEAVAAFYAPLPQATPEEVDRDERAA